LLLSLFRLSKIGRGNAGGLVTAIFDGEVVGTGTTEDSGTFDFLTAFNVYFNVPRAMTGVKIRLRVGEKDVILDPPLVCLSGILLPVCKLSVQFYELLYKSTSLPDLATWFADAANTDMTAKPNDKTSILQPAFADMRACEAILVAKTHVDQCVCISDEKAWLQEILAHVTNCTRSTLRCAAMSINDETRAVLQFLEDLAQKPDLANFQDAVKEQAWDKCYEPCTKPDAVQFYHLFNRFDSNSKDHIQILESMVNAVQIGGPLEDDDLAGFLAATIVSITKEYDTRLQSAGKLLADMTITQTLFRRTQPGETRVGLAKRCIVGLGKRKAVMTPSDSLVQKLKEESAK
jgi:hypothetical protein